MWQSTTPSLPRSYFGVLSLLRDVKQGLLTFIFPKEGDILMGHNEMKGPQGQGLSDLRISETLMFGAQWLFLALITTKRLHWPNTS